ncbi:MAG: hypothetical protein NUV74_05380 [Candidatus Brocadiaceae bacterium]|nr:hypothetical protein [Candidatus Brocadiaceae bacterium]
MRIYAYMIICAAMIAVGWFYRGEHDAKELANAIQKAEQRFQTQRTRQEQERQDLEKQIVSDRQLADQRLRKVTKENSQLREDAARPVLVEFLVFARLCDDPAECTLLYQSRPPEASPPPPRLVTAEDIYRLLADLDQAIITHNLGLEQLKSQLKACQSE